MEALQPDPDFAQELVSEMISVQQVVLDSLLGGYPMLADSPRELKRVHLGPASLVSTSM
jgi:hypothetical protein